MELSILELFLNASVVVKTVIIILILASIVSWMIIFERWLYIKKISQELLDFEIIFWSDAGLDALLSSSQEEGHNPVGAEYIFQVGYLDYKRLTKESLGPDIVMDSVQRNMRVALAKEQSLLEKHLPFLATVASVSPYVGLFGTVWGIMNSFKSIAVAQNTNLSVVAPGIAEALFATALGLFVAIPAVVAYNKISSDLSKYFVSLETFMDEFTTIFFRQLEKK